MSKISKIEIQRIADLCCIDISHESFKTDQEELTNILTFIKQIEKIDTKNIEPMSHSAEITLRLRADKIIREDLTALKKRNYQTPIIMKNNA